METNVVPITSANQIPLSKIREPISLRSAYDDEALDELGGSFDNEGQLQAIVVQETEDGFYELIVGSRRTRAAKRRGRDSILAVVVTGKTPADMLLMALAENLHRRDLNPFEEARAFLQLMREYGFDLKTISERVNKQEHYIRRRIELLTLPEEVQVLIASSKLGLQYVQTLMRVESGAEQVRYAQKAVLNRLTVQELRGLIEREKENPEPIRGSTYQLTPEKVRARLEEYSEWIKKMPQRINVESMNADEKAGILRSIGSVEMQLAYARKFFSESLPGDPDFHRNERQEWTATDIKAIMASDRPNDAVLSRLLGRSVKAIQAMRTKAREKI